ncbi:MAG: amidohydrolase family protein, partial [Alphaproteobacteria bacterium]|nr:amidohydrolase family protein [Alphaproteobacteria bacterium]
KLQTFQSGHIDGHMPGLGLDMPAHGPLINAVGAAGILTDHECTTMKEALEKSKRGIRILIREGTGCKNLEALMPFITKENSYHTAFCTDDFHPADIAQEGHLNFIIRKAIELYDPELHGPDKQTHIENVYRIATYGAANIFGRNHGMHRIGEIAPGAQADIVLLNNLETCDVASVIKSGREVREELFEQRPDVKPVGLHSVKIGKITPDHLKLKSDRTQIPVVNVIADNVLTTAATETLENVKGEVLGDVDRDILKCAVIERHGKTNGNIGIGFVRGFEFDKGAIAASVGHDDHNITVVGVSDEEMALAVNTLKDMGGGYVVVKDGKVLAKLALPIAGLMSDSCYQDVASIEDDIRKFCKTLIKNGKEGLPQPLISLAFISLSVIPDIRICDAGITRNTSTGPKLVWDQRIA